MKIIKITEVKFSDEERDLLHKMFDLVAKISKNRGYCDNISCSICPFYRFCCTNIAELEDYINDHLGD